MNKTLLVLSLGAALGAGAVTAVAQDQQAPQTEGRAHGRRQMDPQQRVNMLAKRLNLTDDQKQKAQTIFADAQQQTQSLQQDSSLSREDKMQKMKTIREDANSKLTGILNDDQKQKYADMQQKMRERMKDHAGQGGNSSNN